MRATVRLEAALTWAKLRLVEMAELESSSSDQQIPSSASAAVEPSAFAQRLGGDSDILPSALLVPGLLKFGLELVSLTFAGKRVLELTPATVNATGPNGLSFIHAAISTDNSTRLASLIALGADPTLRLSNVSPLAFSVQYAKVNCIDILVSEFAASAEHVEASDATVGHGWRIRSDDKEMDNFVSELNSAHIKVTPALIVGIKRVANHPKFMMFRERNETLAVVAAAVGRLDLYDAIEAECDLRDPDSDRRPEARCAWVTAEKTGSLEFIQYLHKTCHFYPCCLDVGRAAAEYGQIHVLDCWKSDSCLLTAVKKPAGRKRGWPAFCGRTPARAAMQQQSTGSTLASFVDAQLH